MTAFTEPEEIIVADEPEAFFAALKRMEQLRRAGKYLAGYMSYEAGFLFEPKLADFAAEPRNVPFLRFGVFSGPQPDEGDLRGPKVCRMPMRSWPIPRPHGALKTIASASSGCTGICVAATVIRVI